MFHFELQAIDTIRPWGGPHDLTLQWFGLSYGTYFIRVGEDELLRYSDAWVEQTRLSDPAEYAGPYVDYQVARLHEDLATLLPFAMCPAPVEIANLLLRLQPARARDRLWSRFTSGDLAAPQLDALEQAMEWLRLIGLDTLYLVAGPVIWVWQSADVVTLQWQSPADDPAAGGAPRWSSERGCFRMPKADFVAAVARFDHDFLAQMEARVASVRRAWSRPEIAIDVAGLAENQVQYTSFIPDAYRAYIIPPAWERIAEGLAFAVEP